MESQAIIALARYEELILKERQLEEMKKGIPHIMISYPYIHTSKEKIMSVDTYTKTLLEDNEAANKRGDEFLNKWNIVSTELSELKSKNFFQRLFNL